MTSIKELKSIDLPSYTIIITTISLIFALIISILSAIGVVILTPDNIIFGLYLIPTIVVGTLMISIYHRFFEGFLYNSMAKKLNPITFTFEKDSELTKISPVPTAIIAATISTIFIILDYLATIFLLPLGLSTLMQTFMFAGQQTLAYSIYQVLLLLNNASTIILIILATFISTFIFVLLGTYIYNIVGSKNRGAVFDLVRDGKITVLESIDVVKLATAFAIVSGILNIVIAIIMLMIGSNIQSAIGQIVMGFVGGFIGAAFFAVFYNYLSPKLGKLKIELIDA